MTRAKLILSVGAMCCLLLSVRADSQESGSHSGVLARESRLQLLDAETYVKMYQLELKMSELAVDEAMVELEKIKLHLEAAREQGDSREVGYAELELKQAAIRVEMRRVQSQMIRLKVERAEVGLEHMGTAITEKPRKRSRVQVEYVDDLDVLVIRGAKEDVDRITDFIEGAEEEKQEKK